MRKNDKTFLIINPGCAYVCKVLSDILRLLMHALVRKLIPKRVACHGPVTISLFKASRLPTRWWVSVVYTAKRTKNVVNDYPYFSFRPGRCEVL